jgi:hypothetical protein
MDRFRWYDWVVIFITADIASAMLMALLTGNAQVAILIPLIAMAWYSYEDFRVRQENERDGK